MEVTKSEADNKISLQTSLLNWIEEQIRLRLMFLPVSMDKSPDIQQLNFKLQSIKWERSDSFVNNIFDS